MHWRLNSGAAPAKLSNLFNIEVASPFQYFGDQCCIESLGKLPPKGLGYYIVNVSAISPNSLLGLPGATAANTGSSNITTRRAGTTRRGGGRSQHTGRAATPATGFHRLFLCFSFFGGGVWRPVAPVAGLPPCVLTRPRGTNARGAGPGCGGRRQHTEGSLQRRTTDRPPSSPEQRTRESLAERRLRTLWRPVEPAEVPASPHQSQRATAGGAVWASSADAARLRRRGSGCSAARRSQGAPRAARAQGLVAGGWRLLLGSIYKV